MAGESSSPEEESSCDVSSTTGTAMATFSSQSTSLVSSQGAVVVSSLKKQVNRGRWTKEEDEKLKDMAISFGENNWTFVASQYPDRSDVQCQQRWDKVVNPQLVKGPWTKEVR